MGELQADELRAKWALPKPMLADARQTAPAAKASGLDCVKVCPGCHAQGTITKQDSGFRVMTQVCEMCNGEGCLVDGKPPVDKVAEAQKLEDAKLAQVVDLLSRIENLTLLDAVEARLRAQDVEGALSLAQGGQPAPAGSSAAAAAATPPSAEKKGKDAPPTADTALEVEGLASQADADRVEAAIKELEGVLSASVDLGKKQAKVVSSPGFPTSDKMIEAVQAAGFKATEKRLAGGMFKFDPAEVDVEGGTATADDFMDAFGF